MWICGWAIFTLCEVIVFDEDDNIDSSNSTPTSNRQSSVSNQWGHRHFMTEYNKKVIELVYRKQIKSSHDASPLGWVDQHLPELDASRDALRPSLAPLHGRGRNHAEFGIRDMQLRVINVPFLQDY